ncbi:Carboxylesterase, type B [Minicystis rosea]|nr:Carboxylesterase, type B [Minicystis rosea]
MLRTSSLAVLSIGILFAAGCGSNGEGTGGSPGTGGTGTGTGGAGTGGSGTGGGEAMLVVKTDKGSVQGALLGDTRAFLGIPYAAPPTGAQRWKSPEPAAAWTETRDATKKGAFCPQMSQLGKTPMTGTSEDCLTVNVWTPAAAPPTTLPVLVWIHGGGFVGGSGGEGTYDGAQFSAATGAVVITLNYRLGPLGWLGHSALTSEDAAHPSSGMYGFEDQRAALAWVKANAAAFGGNPDNVTLFGESAGGISTCLHLFSPKSEGLFHRVIVESGACTLPGSSQSQAEAQGNDFATALGCTDSSKTLECLRGKTPDEILLALPGKVGEIGPDGAAWVPVVDQFNIADQPSKLLAQGKFTKMPVILGSNRDEGTIFFSIGLTVTTEGDYTTLMDGMFGGNGAAIVAKYPASAYGDSLTKAASAAVGDGFFSCPARRTARGFAAGGSSVYFYHFTNAPKTLFGDLGSFHSAEVPFIFQNAYLGITLDEDQQKLSATMQKYWLGLAKAGDPNTSGAPTWPKYDAAKDENLTLDLEITTQAGLKKDACDFWDGLVK